MRREPGVRTCQRCRCHYLSDLTLVHRDPFCPSCRADLGRVATAKWHRGVTVYQRIDRILRAREEGMTLREIGELEGVSPGRISQLEDQGRRRRANDPFGQT